MENNIENLSLKKEEGVVDSTPTISDTKDVSENVLRKYMTEEEIKRIDNLLKNMPQKVSLCVKQIHNACVLDEFKISKDELSAVLTDMERRREFLNRNLEKELDRYATRYGEDTSWDDEDDLK